MLLEDAEELESNERKTIDLGYVSLPSVTELSLSCSEQFNSNNVKLNAADIICIRPSSDYLDSTEGRSNKDSEIAHTEPNVEEFPSGSYDTSFPTCHEQLNNSSIIKSDGIQHTNSADKDVTMGASDKLVSLVERRIW